MDVLTDGEIDSIINKSKIAPKYNKVIDSQSAYEILTAKLQEAAEKTQQQTDNKKPSKEEESTIDRVLNNTVVKSMARTAGNTIVRSLLGALGMGGRTNKKSKSWI